MNEQNKNHKDNMNDNSIAFQGGYISYDPNVLTEHYTVEGFEGKIEKSQESKSRWC